MNKIDRLALDGHLLRLFLAVLESGSVTAAATRLDLTQSAVSHALRRLADLVGEPLFVKSGRGVAPTAHALALREPASALLAGLEAFGARPGFDPAEAEIEATVAANDLQRELLLPSFVAELERRAARVFVRVIPSGSPTADMLRAGGCDLLITPYPPDGTDIVQRTLFRDSYACFYDPETRSAPTAAEYRAARHVTVIYPDGGRLDFDRRLQSAGLRRDFAVAVPSFSGVPAFLRGTDRLATMPSLFRHTLMRGFAVAPAALDGQGGDMGELAMTAAWHKRADMDPRHRWLRRVLADVAAGVRRRADGAERPKGRSRA